jgi:hypothetical protein
LCITRNDAGDSKENSNVDRTAEGYRDLPARPGPQDYSSLVEAIADGEDVGDVIEDADELDLLMGIEGRMGRKVWL